jgi:hypothetical protein
VAYGVKYQLLCKGKDGITSKTVISEDGYTGAEIDRNVPSNPFQLRKDSGAVIIGTSLEFLIREVVDFEFLSFYTNNPKKFKIEFFYPSTTPVWSGYLNPQQYEVPYKPGPTNVRLQATDGLGLLNGESFTLTGYQTQLTIIRHCLDKIGLGLSYAIAISLWEISHNDAYCPLAQTLENCAMFSDKKCNEVLEAILGKYDATITQNKNRWEILSYKDKKAVRLIYTSAGVYSTTEAAPTVLNLTSIRTGNNVRPVGSLTLSLQPGGKRVKISSDYGLKPSILDNYKFENYDMSSAAFPSWGKNGSVSVYPRKKDDLNYAFLSGYANTDNDYIHQSVDVVEGLNQDFQFTFDVCPTGMIWSSMSNPSSINLTIRVQVRLVAGATTYYLATSGWSTTPGYITQELQSAMYPGNVTWTRISIITGGIPASGTMTVRLQRIKASTFGPSISGVGVAFALPSPTFLFQNKSFITGFEDTANFTGSSEPGELSDIEIIGADVPVYDNAVRMYGRAMRLSSGLPTVSWRFSQSDTAYSLIGAMAKMLASRNQVPRQILRGIVRGANLTMASMIRDTYNSNREFEIVECNWNVYEGTWEGTLLEFMPYVSRDVEFDSGVSLGDAADLTVSTVTPTSTSLSAGQSSYATINVDNTGDSTGCQTVEWKLVNGSDVTQSSGSVSSGIIPATGDVDIEIPYTVPATAGTYYVKSKISTDASWVSSAAIIVSSAPAITLNSISTISDGGSGSDIIASFNATNTGGAGSKTIYWEIRDYHWLAVDSGSQSVNISIGTANYNLTGLRYPSLGESNTLAIGLSIDDLNVVSNEFESLPI